MMPVLSIRLDEPKEGLLLSSVAPHLVIERCEWLEVRFLPPHGETLAQVFPCRRILGLVAVRHDNRGIGVRSFKIDGDERPERAQAATIAAFEARADLLETRPSNAGTSPWNFTQ
jgi:hypothetical protein